MQRLSLQIAADFVKWLNDLEDGGEAGTVDVETIIKMFDIVFTTHAATSLCVRVKEMPSIVQDVADRRGIKWVGIR